MLYCNRFIILFTQIIHKKQTQTKTSIFNITVQYLEKYSSTVQQVAFRGWHRVNRQEVTEWRRRDSKREKSWRIFSNRRPRASCNLIHAWCWWNACLHLWKFATWRSFVCRGLTELAKNRPSVNGAPQSYSVLHLKVSMVGALSSLPILENESEVALSCPTLCNPMDCSLRVSSIHGNFQAWVLEWVAFSFSRGSSPPRDWAQVSSTANRHFYCLSSWCLPHGGHPINMCWVKEWMNEWMSECISVRWIGKYGNIEMERYQKRAPGKKGIQRKQTVHEKSMSSASQFFYGPSPAYPGAVGKMSNALPRKWACWLEFI